MNKKELKQLQSDLCAIERCGDRINDAATRAQWILIEITDALAEEEKAGKSVKSVIVEIPADAPADMTVAELRAQAHVNKELRQQAGLRRDALVIRKQAAKLQEVVAAFPWDKLDNL